MKNKVIDYVMNSPGNTNRAVLESLLNGVIDGGDSGGSSDYTGLPCYAFHQWTEETDDFLGSDMAMVKISDDIPEVVSGQRCITFDVTSEEPPSKSLLEVMEDEEIGVRIPLANDESSGLMVCCIIDEGMSALTGASAGIWCAKLIAEFGKMAGGAYMIIV